MASSVAIKRDDTTNTSTIDDLYDAVMLSKQIIPNTGIKGHLHLCLCNMLCAMRYVCRGCRHCIPPEEIIANRDVRGKTQLPICSGCYDEDEDEDEDEPPFSGTKKSKKR